MCRFHFTQPCIISFSDKFYPCPIIKDSESENEDDLGGPVDSKKIKLEPVDEFTIKKERTDEESKMGSSPSYTLHSTGGLKIVIKTALCT